MTRFENALSWIGTVVIFFLAPIVGVVIIIYAIGQVT